MLLFRRVQGQSRATKSGNRPRFKAFGQDAEEDAEDEDGRAQDRQRRSLKAGPAALINGPLKPATNWLLIVISITLSIISFEKPANCDHHDNNTSTIISGLDSKDSLKVAALATKLEHWFACRRPNAIPMTGNEAAALDSSSAPNVSQFGDGAHQPGSRLAAANCPAHFDGHLCWPASPLGQSVRLPCPRLNWLPSKQQPIKDRHSVKSVISSIQTPEAQVNAPSTAESIKPITRMASDTHLNTNSSRITEPTTLQQQQQQHDDANQQRQQQDEASQFAYRKCAANPKRDLVDSTKQTVAAQWQLEADYSACQRDSGTRTSSGYDPTDEWINLGQEQDKRLFSSLVDELDRLEGSIDPYSDLDLQEQWSLCIGNIMRNQQMTTSLKGPADQQQQQPNDLWCPIIFDGWRCWPSTRASETAYVSCPSNQPGFSAERKAHKVCTSDGTWYRHPMTNRYWSNYTTCVDTVDLAFRTKILNLYVIGNLISLIALSASLIIFISFKNLNCTRVTIHKNLFLSFIANNLMWIAWYTKVVNDADLLQTNPIMCQFWHVVLHYFLVSNYFWMFCEGLYLHTLLVVAFVSEDKILKWFYLLGWLTPIPITVAYAFNRSYDEYYTSYCWMEESPYNLILIAPIVISLMLNFIFLINIVRVLVTKLRANNSPDTHQTRKAVRATCLLIPLLGLHYILTPFRPEAKSEWEGIYESVAAVCTSFQGLCVAMLFCFCNGEVITAIKKKLKDTFNLSHSRRGAGGGGRGGDFMRNRSNTTCTSIGIMGPGFNGSSGAIQNSTITAAVGGGDSIRALGNADAEADDFPCKLLQNRHSLAYTPFNHVNGTNSNTSNSSSLLTSVTVSPNATTTAQPNTNFDPLLLVACGETNAKQGDSISIQEKINIEQLEPSLENVGDRVLGLDEDLVVREESVKLLQNGSQKDDGLVTTSFSIPI